LIVLDTHVLIWAVQDDPKLGKAAKALIEAEALDSEVLIPAICAWEVALIVAREQVDLGCDTTGWMRRVQNGPGYRLAALEPEIAVASVDMAWSHKDPADRMIVATAQHWEVPVLTADRKILGYAEAGHLQAVDARR
jgi:PIN domain nuclease of toxin-antitoxin system